MLLEGKVALIIGAAKGFGRVCAGHFAQEGAKIIVADIDDSEGQKTIESIMSSGKEAAFLHVDVRSVGELEKVIHTASNIYDRIDIFWYNAGVFFPGHIEVIQEEDYDCEMEVGLKGAVFGTKFIIPVMKNGGGGCILYTSSMVGLRPNPYNKSYSLSHGLEKAGIVMLMRCVVEPLAAYNIRVNCICPGPIPTKLWEDIMNQRAISAGIDPQAARKAAGDRLPIKRLISEDEIARAAAFLVSDQALGVSGVAFPIDGGYSAI